MRNTLSGGATLCALATLLALAGCGGSGSAITGGAGNPVVGAAHNYVGTQSPGDVWNWSLGGSAFSASNTTRSFGYSGTSSLLASGFYKLTVSESTDSTAPVGSVAYAFDVPGVAFIAQPAGSVPNPIVGAALGSNPPPGSARYNWIKIPTAGWSPSRDEAYGTAIISVNEAGAGTIAITQQAIDGSIMGTHTQPASFTSGQFVTGETTGLITPAGMIMVDNGPDQGGVFGVKAPAAAVDMADLTSKEYRGIVFLGGAQGGHSELLRVTPDGSGALTAIPYSDVEANTLDTEHQAPLTFGAQSSPGLINGVLHLRNGAVSMVLAVNKIGGKYMIYGFASDNYGSPDNFLFIEK